MAEDGYKKRRRAFRLGHLAEFYAAAYLLFRGYRILQLRYRTKAGEIDIIARKGNLIAFVEVKARRTVEDALFSVGERNKARIRAASRIWLAKQKDFSELSWRYDILAVTPWRLPSHVPDAF
ncbi:YraN family protein [Rhizobium sp. L1K21]|uniref:YraN family protein n=1 Tax=Rhizobium sp. L1K21 TaxID=2954933 RepID=UPI00209231E2|nr:YraN family protein [Rhizobium sp. L1K21]MCO6187341.1 YraN family protein [Rhizobium sp. L1K21]